MRIDKNDHQRKNALIIFQILPTNSVRKCIEINWRICKQILGLKGSNMFLNFIGFLQISKQDPDFMY